jgi:tetratricopeptide (TPR) repeat protein
MRPFAPLAGLAILLTIACGRHDESRGSGAATAAPSETASIQPVPLPDISRAAADVQAQLREQHATMTSAVAQSSATPADRAAAYAEMGKLFIATELYAAAERCFQNARALAPGDMRWVYYLAQVARLAGEPDKAAGLFEQTLTVQPDHVPSLVWLADLRLAQSQPARARPLLEKARRLEPREAAALYGLGRVALEERQYAQAVTDLEAALALIPSASRVRYPLAMAYRGLGDTAKAEAQLRLRGEVDLPPADGLMGEIGSLLKNAAAFETRAVKAMDARNWPEAVTSLEQAVAVAPGNAFTRLNLGTSLYMMGQADRALEQYRTAVRLAPGLARAHFGIGVILESRKQDAGAIEAFTRAVESDGGLAEARFSLANALRRTNRTEASLAHYDAILRGNPAASQASFGYAIALVRLGRYQEARARLERDVTAYPDQPGFAHALARVLAAAPDDRVRDGARALSMVQALVRGQPPSLPLAETMAMALAESGRFDEAVRWQSDALQLARQARRPDLVRLLTPNLRLYESRRPCRTPWTDDDPVHHPQPASE